MTLKTTVSILQRYVLVWGKYIVVTVAIYPRVYIWMDMYYNDVMTWNHNLKVKDGFISQTVNELITFHSINTLIV